ncbi:hypothetical protein [Scleromatobacter humisilvae]|uniref:Uncharacterized protein n=1 Tax=Scleromatobacter humisilvae TaxID=2897159 RepID=A0A9X1YE42_9BURK|nr:hypothetical protein [Scleromatobacter humisilvae]MCK9684278.1 hypothetical protein [Scleromatobacter humisilvae]
MSGFIEIQHDEWVAATPDVARAHYNDLSHRDVARVHPRERLRQLPPGPAGPRFERLVRPGWRTRREVWERLDRPDGSVLDQCIAGAHWGRSIVARFYRSDEGGRTGTLVELTLTQPLRPVLAPILGRWFRRRLEAELREFAAEIKVDVERGYNAGRRLRVA